MHALPGREQSSRPDGRLELLAQTALLARTARALLADERPRDLLRGPFRRLSAHLGLELYFGYRLTADGSALRFDSYAGVPDELARQIERLEIGQAVCGTVAARRRPPAGRGYLRGRRPGGPRRRGSRAEGAQLIAAIRSGGP